jgi:hypothetical protein
MTNFTYYIQHIGVLASVHGGPSILQQVHHNLNTK